MYVSEACRVRKITAATGIINTIAGSSTSGSYSGDNGAATSAALWNPSDIAVSSSGNLVGTDNDTPFTNTHLLSIGDIIYITDNGNHRIRRVYSSVIKTVAGTGTAGFSGNGGQATSAMIKYPSGIGIDKDGNFYFGTNGDVYNVVRKVTVSTGIITSVAGTASTTGGYNGDNIQATSATLNDPTGIAIDKFGDIYICDRSNQRLRKVDVATGLITTIAGNGGTSSSGDNGEAKSASLVPARVHIDDSNIIYITDSANYYVRKVIFVATDIPSTTPSAVPSTQQPSRTPSMTPSTTPSAIPSQPSCAPSVSPSIFSSQDIITTIAGTGGSSYSGDDGPATSAGLDPQGVRLDSSGMAAKTVLTYCFIHCIRTSNIGNVYIADYNNGRVRKIIVSTGIITTFAGTGINSYSGDGGAATSAALYAPSSIFLDSAGGFTLHLAILVDTHTFLL